MRSREPDGFARLDRCSDRGGRTSISQPRSLPGRMSVQLFDSWAGVLSPGRFERWCEAPARRIASRLKTRYPDGSGHRLSARRRRLLSELRGEGTGRRAQPRHDRAVWPGRGPPCAGVCLQGNLDPGGIWSRAATSRAGKRAASSRRSADRPFIFNLGHGVLPQTDPAAVGGPGRLRQIGPAAGERAAP